MYLRFYPSLSAILSIFVKNCAIFVGNTHVQMSNKPQLPSAQPTSCVAPESSGKNPCYSLVSAPLLAIGGMELIQVALVKKLPSGPLQRAKKSKKLNPK